MTLFEKLSRPSVRVQPDPIELSSVTATISELALGCLLDPQLELLPGTRDVA